MKNNNNKRDLLLYVWHWLILILVESINWFGPFQSLQVRTTSAISNKIAQWKQTCLCCQNHFNNTYLHTIHMHIDWMGSSLFSPHWYSIKSTIVNHFRLNIFVYYFELEFVEMIIIKETFHLFYMIDIMFALCCLSIAMFPLNMAHIAMFLLNMAQFLTLLLFFFYLQLQTPLALFNLVDSTRDSVHQLILRKILNPFVACKLNHSNLNWKSFQFAVMKRHHFFNIFFMRNGQMPKLRL